MLDPDLHEPEPVPKPSQLWQPWALIVPAVLLLPMLSLAFAWQISPSSDADLRRPVHHYPRGAETLEPEPTPEPTPATAVATLPPAVNLQKLTYFVPDDDGNLHAKTALSTGGNKQSGFAEFGSAALKALFPEASDYFPAGTQLQSLSQDESDPSLARVSLNEKFWNSDYWSGESRTGMAMQSIAHTLQAAYQQTGHKGTLHVQLLRDDHEMFVLGEYDVRVPYTPDSSVVVAGKPTPLASVKKR